MELVVALIAGLAIFVVIVGLFSRPAADPVQARLTSFTAGSTQTLEQLELERPFFDRTLRPAAGRFAGVAQRINSPARVSRTEQRLALAGYPGGMRTIDFLGLKVMFSVGAAIAAFVLIGIVGGNLAFGFIFAIVLALIAYVGTEFWLSSHAKGRQKKILRALPDTLDLLTISVRAGLGFEGALAKVVEKVPGPLSEEFGRALAEIRIGRPRRDALRDIVDRTDVGPLATFIGAIIQAEQLGVPIAKVLQIQSEQLRIERRQRAEEMAARAPIKMLFPLVGCIFPSMFIVILGPAIILIIQNLQGPNAPGKAP
jgi:tight adherence protein C